MELKSVLYLKREDLHPYKSHKGRSIPAMLEKYRRDGWKSFCISSSGNAAIAAAMAINKYNAIHKKSPLTLNIFTGKNIDKEKLKIIKANTNKNIVLKKTDNPKQSAFQMDKTGLTKNLRQSTDDTALAGYASLAKELTKIKNLSAIFIPTSSGTTAQALHEELNKLNLNPQIHIVQTEANHPIADIINPDFSKLKPAPSIATAIVDKTAHRKEQVAQAVKLSQGNAWVCNNREIKNAITLAKKTEKINISPNSALAIAGLAQAIKNSWHFNGPVVCLLTGK